MWNNWNDDVITRISRGTMELESMEISDISNHAFFKGFDPEIRNQLIAKGTFETYQDGTVLFNENDESDCVYLVIEGEIKLTKKTRNDQVETLARVESGGYFGEMGVIDRCGRSAGACTIGKTTLVRIPAEPLLHVLRTGPGEVALYFFRRISEYLRTTNTRFISEVIRKERMQLLGEMSSSIIHDFKNPMTSIRLAAEMISAKTEDESMVGFCNILLRQVERMHTMVQEVLDYSRGRSRLDRKDANLSNILKELEVWNIDYASKCGVTLSIQPADVTVHVDKDRLLRALQNILSNAIQSFEIEGGTVSVAITKKRETDVTIEIADNGPGIPEHIRDKIFEPFVTHGKHAGTGLGMPIAKTIIEAHDGELSFVSEIDKGTTFKVTLPTGDDRGEFSDSERGSTSAGIPRG